MKKVLLIIMILFFSDSSMCEDSGEQHQDFWAKKNLNVRTFRNGDSIFFAHTPEEWFDASKNSVPACCYVGFDSEFNSSEKEGLLYNGYAVADPRDLAPEGWKIPDTNAWKRLSKAFRTKVKTDSRLSLTQKTYRRNNDIFGCLIDQSQSGVCEPWGTYWEGTKIFWTIDSETDTGHCVNLWSNGIYIFEFLKGYGLYVRCIKSE